MPGNLGRLGKKDAKRAAAKKMVVWPPHPNMPKTIVKQRSGNLQQKEEKRKYMIGMKG